MYLSEQTCSQSRTPHPTPSRRKGKISSSGLFVKHPLGTSCQSTEVGLWRIEGGGPTEECARPQSPGCAFFPFWFLGDHPYFLGREKRNWLCHPVKNTQLLHPCNMCLRLFSSHSWHLCNIVNTIKNIKKDVSCITPFTPLATENFWLVRGVFFLRKKNPSVVP